MSVKTHSITFTVKDHEIDHMGHVNNVVYVQWIQDVAGAHWESAARKEDQEKYGWVVLRHEIDYLKSAMPNDEITATTWVESLNGVKSIRMVEIKRKDEILVKSRTTWIMLDAQTGRPARVTPEIQKPFL